MDQTCENVTRTIPAFHAGDDQTAAIADSYWMCGDNILYNVLPHQWVGLCTPVRLKLHATVAIGELGEALGVQNDGSVHGRMRREVARLPEVYMNWADSPERSSTGVQSTR